MGNTAIAHKQMTIPIFIPHLGCGHSCTFCNQRVISGVEREPERSAEQIQELIEEWLSFETKATYIEIGFFGGSFTGIPVNEQEKYLQVAKNYLDAGKIHGIRLSTRPDYIDPEVVERLTHFGVTMVELGVQSFSNDVLSQVKRGHTTAQTLAAIDCLRKAGIGLGIQLMLGLPGDNKTSFLESVRTAIAIHPSCVRLYPTLVLKHTELADHFEAGLYKPLSIEDAVDQTLEAYLAFLKADIPVIRIGLHASEGLSEPGVVLAGPHHDAFRTLVESKIFRRMIERDLEHGLPDTQLSVRVHPKHVSFFSGHKQSNLIWLKSKGISLIKIHKDPEMALYEIKWETQN